MTTLAEQEEKIIRDIDDFTTHLHRMHSNEAENRIVEGGIRYNKNKERNASESGQMFRLVRRSIFSLYVLSLIHI